MTWLWANFGLVWQLTVEHIALSAPPVLLGLVISLPFGWLANRYRVSRGVILTIGGILYAVPSLPLFIMLPAILGTKILDPVNVVVALTIYAVALMVRVTADALVSVEPAVVQSATAVGFSTWARFWQVELPLSGPVLLAGLRVVSVSTVSLVSVGALIGVSSLGNLFLDGFYRSFPTEIVIGIVGTIVIALVFDAVLVICGRLLMPWSRTERPDRSGAADVGVEQVRAG
ncbi:MAG: ABC transporter permease [Microbacteriaceae bacterium]